MKLFKLQYVHSLQQRLPQICSCMLYHHKDIAASPPLETRYPRLFLFLHSQYPVTISCQFLFTPLVAPNGLFCSLHPQQIIQIKKTICLHFNLMLYVACMFTKFKPVITPFYSDLTLAVFKIWELLWTVKFKSEYWGPTIESCVAYYPHWDVSRSSSWTACVFNFPLSFQLDMVLFTFHCEVCCWVPPAAKSPPHHKWGSFVFRGYVILGSTQNDYRCSLSNWLQYVRICSLLWRKSHVSNSHTQRILSKRSWALCSRAEFEMKKKKVPDFKDRVLWL